MLFCSCIFQSFYLPRLEKRELILVLFVRLLRFALIWFCPFSLSLFICDGLRLVIVALSGHFLYLFLFWQFVILVLLLVDPV